MFKKIAIGAAASVSALIALPATASAQGYYYDGYNRSGYDRQYSRSYDRGYVPYRRGDYYGRAGGYDRHYRGGYGYPQQGYAYPQQGYAYPQRGYAYPQRGYDYRQRCGSGTTGAIVGGAAGALVGREISRGGRNRYYGRNNGTTGAIIGGAIGALVGREVSRGC